MCYKRFVKKILSVSMILLALFTIPPICKAATIRGSVMEIHYGAGRAAGAERVTVTLYRGVFGSSGSVIYCLPSDDDFYPGGEQRDERRFRLAYIAQREKTLLIYEYDFGDGWEHEVVVEKVLAADSEKKCAVCLDGKNARRRSI
jgi:hypothetical protein